MTITIYYSSVSGSRQVKQQQNEIFQFLDSKQIKYFIKDIAESLAVKDEMRKKVGNPNALAPQVFNGDKYCGLLEIMRSNPSDAKATCDHESKEQTCQALRKDEDYKMFFDAVEDGNAERFFRL